MRTADRSDVGVTGEKRATSVEGLDDVSLVAEQDGDGLTLRVERDHDPLIGPGPTMDLSIRVPRDLHVARVEMSNGETRIAGVVGPLAVDTVNGDVDVLAVRGGLTVTNTNGEVTIEGVEGDVTVTGTNGDITVEGATGDVDVETTNDDVTFRVSRQLDARVDLSNDNGEITVEGVEGLTSGADFPATVGDGRRDISVDTTNGDIELVGVG